MKILLPIFFLLFACWMLWGWVVGESKEIKWLRRWCATIFVVTAMLIAAGAGIAVTRGLVRTAVRNDVAKLLDAIEQRIQMGESARVVSEIRATDHSDDPDKDAFDLLDHLTVMQQNLSDNTETIAKQPDTSVRR